MSTPLAIAAVTAMLKDLLNNGLFQHDLSGLGSFAVTASPPDRITTGDNEPNQLNLFLYQVTPNLGWRNEGQPTRDSAGVRLANPPLALDLHYMLTAYGSQDLFAEVLLGYAMFLLHQTPVLTRAQLRTVLGPPPPVDGSILPTAFKNLPVIDLADQIEILKITPVYLTTEDLSKMWTAMQARYRPTMAYMVSVVLIQGTASVKTATPVLKRGKDDSGFSAVGSAPALLSSARSALSDAIPGVRLGDDVLLAGANLSGGSTAQFQNPVEGSATTPATVGTISTSQMTVHIPSIAEDANAMNQWAIGTYSVTLTVPTSAGPVETNAVPVALCPLITVNPLSAAPGDLELTVTCSPRLHPDQQPQTQLVFGSQTVLPDSFTNPVDTTQPSTLTFKISGVIAGTYIVRLRVQGIDSLPVKIQGSAIDFDPQQKVTIA